MVEAPRCHVKTWKAQVDNVLLGLQVQRRQMTRDCHVYNVTHRARIQIMMPIYALRLGTHCGDAALS